DPAKIGLPNTQFDVAEMPAVAADRNGNFYVAWVQHNTANTDGVMTLLKFTWQVDANPASPTFNSLVPTVANLDPTGPTGGGYENVIYQWFGHTAADANPAFTPAIAIDTNLPSFTDPDTGVTQTDPNAGRVYVLWNTNNAAPAGDDTGAGTITNFNPNT